MSPQHPLQVQSLCFVQAIGGWTQASAVLVETAVAIAANVNALAKVRKNWRRGILARLLAGSFVALSAFLSTFTTTRAAKVARWASQSPLRPSARIPKVIVSTGRAIAHAAMAHTQAMTAMTKDCRMQRGQ